LKENALPRHSPGKKKKGTYTGEDKKAPGALFLSWLCSSYLRVAEAVEANY